MNVKRRHVNTFAIIVVGVGIQLYYKIKFLLLGQLNLADLWHWMTLVELLFSLLLAAVVIFGHDFVVRFLRSRFSDNTRQLHRLILQISATSIYSIAASWAFSIFFWDYILQLPMTSEYLFDFVIVALFIPLFVNGLTESLYYYGEWDSISTKKEQLEKENIRARYEILKTQISPHFLFNCFNTLAVLINESKKAAGDFLSQLSKVYRFVLETKESEIIRLKDELEIFRSYIKLLKIRFGESFLIKNEITSEQEELFIAPLTMQLLLENALKHNVSSANDPLEISVKIKDRALVFKNTLSSQVVSESTNIGIQNISSRYKYLTGERVVVDKNDKFFAINVPLINVESI